MQESHLEQAVEKDTSDFTNDGAKYGFLLWQKVAYNVASLPPGLLLLLLLLCFFIF